MFKRPRLDIFRSFAIASAIGLVPCLSACPGETGDGSTDGGVGDGDGDNDGGMMGDGDGDGDCPDGQDNSQSICQIRKGAAAGGEVTARNLIATSDVFDITDAINGVFVSDSPLAQFGGALVIFPTDAGFAVARGDRVDVTGTLTEFSSMTAAESEMQIDVGTTGSITVRASEAPPAPLDVTDVATLASEGYEGMLVKIGAATTTNADAGGGRFEVEVGATTVRIAPSAGFFYAPIGGETFTSITGVLRYNTFDTGSFELAPRDMEDVVSDGVDLETRTIREFRDPGSANYTGECPFDQTCDTYLIENAVVVSPTLVVSSGDEGPFLFGFYIADPNEVNAEGELGPYSGIYVTVAPSSNDLRNNDYTFGEDDMGNFVNPWDGDAADFPAIGDVVTVAGQHKPYFDFSQVSNTIILTKVGTTDSVAEVTMPLPAQFDAATAAALKGGRPEASAADFGTAAAAASEPSAEIEQWEGVLVQLNDVTTTDACPAVPFAPGGDSSAAYSRDFGYWMVDGEVEMGTQFSRYFNPSFGGYWTNDAVDQVCANVTDKCGDSRVDGQAFSELVGIVNFSFDVWRVNPRTPADVAPGDLFVENTCQ